MTQENPNGNCRARACARADRGFSAFPANRSERGARALPKLLALSSLSFAKCGPDGAAALCFMPA